MVGWRRGSRVEGRVDGGWEWFGVLGVSSWFGLVCCIYLRFGWGCLVLWFFLVCSGGGGDCSGWGRDVLCGCVYGWVGVGFVVWFGWFLLGRLEGGGCLEDIEV